MLEIDGDENEYDFATMVWTISFITFLRSAGVLALKYPLSVTTPLLSLCVPPAFAIFIKSATASLSLTNTSPYPTVKVRCFFWSNKVLAIMGGYILVFPGENLPSPITIVALIWQSRPSIIGFTIPLL